VSLTVSVYCVMRRMRRNELIYLCHVTDTFVSACLLDICFVVDYSGSIRDTNPPGVDNWQLVIDFMVRVVSDINIGPTTTHVGVVSFGITS